MKIGRPNENIKHLQAERLKIIMKQQGLNQSKLAPMVPISQQSLSRLMTGGGCIAEDTAKRIVSLFPDYNYNYKWLMGYDDIPYCNDENEIQYFNTLERNQNVIKAFVDIIKNEYYHGVNINIDEPINRGIFRTDIPGIVAQDEIEKVTGNPCVYTATIEGETTEIPPLDFFLIADDLAQYAKFKLKEYANNKKRGLI